MNERLPLSTLLAEKGKDLDPIVPFAAFRGEIPCIVTAVLERTAAVQAVGNQYDTGAVRLELLLVDPTSVEWQSATGMRFSETGLNNNRRWNGARRPEPKTKEELQAARDKSDEGARKNQAEVAQAEEIRKKADRARAQREAASLSETSTVVEKPEVSISLPPVLASGLYDRHGKPLRLDPQAQARAEELLAQQGVRIEAAAAPAPAKDRPIKKDGGPDPADRRAWRREQQELGKTGQRRCPICRQIKDLEKEFPKSKKGRCTTCNREYQSDWAHDKLKGETTRKGPTRISLAESRELAERGLKRCPKCGQVKPIKEFNSAGYCSCRFVNGKSPSPAALELNVRRHPDATVETPLPTPSWKVEPTPPREEHDRSSTTTSAVEIPLQMLESRQLLERLKRLRQERDDARQERDEARAELARVYANIQEALAE